MIKIPSASKKGPPKKSCALSQRGPPPAPLTGTGHLYSSILRALLRSSGGGGPSKAIISAMCALAV